MGHYLVGIGANLAEPEARKRALALVNAYTGDKRFVFVVVPTDDTEQAELVASDKVETMDKLIDTNAADPHTIYGAYWDLRSPTGKTQPIRQTTGTPIVVRPDPGVTVRKKSMLPALCLGLAGVAGLVAVSEKKKGRH